jgi:hypothetical protein
LLHLAKVFHKTSFSCFPGFLITSFLQLAEVLQKLEFGPLQIEESRGFTASADCVSSTHTIREVVCQQLPEQTRSRDFVDAGSWMRDGFDDVAANQFGVAVLVRQCAEIPQCLPPAEAARLWSAGCGTQVDFQAIDVDGQVDVAGNASQPIDELTLCCWIGGESVNGHDWKQLLYGPAVRDRLKE